MKQTMIVFMLLLTSLVSFSQNSTVVQGNVNTKIWNKGWLQIDSGLNIPTHDTVGINRNITILNGKLYIKNSSSGHWTETGSGGGGNQILTFNNDTLSISNGNSVRLPFKHKSYETFVGSTGSLFELTRLPTSKSNVLCLLNSAPIDPIDFSLNNKIVILNFNLETSDVLTIYYNSYEKE